MCKIKSTLNEKCFDTDKALPWFDALSSLIMKLHNTNTSSFHDSTLSCDFSLSPNIIQKKKIFKFTQSSKCVWFLIKMIQFVNWNVNILFVHSIEFEQSNITIGMNFAVKHQLNFWSNPINKKIKSLLALASHTKKNKCLCILKLNAIYIKKKRSGWIRSNDFDAVVELQRNKKKIKNPSDFGMNHKINFRISLQRYQCKW